MQNKSVKELQSEEKALQFMNQEYQQLINKLTAIATTIEDSVSFLYFNGDFSMTLVSKDVISVKKIRVTKPPYKLGHYSEYFSFRVDKPDVINVGKHWGDAAWLTASPDCFILLRNGHKEFSNHIKEE